MNFYTLFSIKDHGILHADKNIQVPAVIATILNSHDNVFNESSDFELFDMGDLKATASLCTSLPRETLSAHASNICSISARLSAFSSILLYYGGFACVYGPDAGHLAGPRVSITTSRFHSYLSPETVRNPSSDVIWPFTTFRRISFFVATSF